MSYRIENTDIIIGGFEKGIADSPYSGINDMRNVNITSIPGEASVALATSQSSSSSASGTLTATAGAGPTTVTFTASGSWTAPTGVYQISVESFGGGAGAGGGGCGGGGGGAYAKTNSIRVVPGTAYTITVGPGGVNNGGDTSFGDASQNLAKGGIKNSGVSGGSGGLASASIGDVKHSGGTGGNEADNGSGDGGNGGGGGGGNASGDGGNGGNGNGNGGAGGGGGAGGNNGGAGGINGGAGGNGSSGTGGTGGGGIGADGTGTGGGGGGNNAGATQHNGGAGGSSGGGGGGGSKKGGADAAGGAGGVLGGGAGGGSGSSGGRGELRITYTVNSTLSYSGLSGTLFNERAITFSGGSLPSGLSAGTNYFIRNLDTNAKTFEVTTQPDLATANVPYITGNGSGTFASIDMAKVTYFATGIDNSGGLQVYYYFAIDSNGRVWFYLSSSSIWVYLNNTTLTNAFGNGLAVYNGYLFLWRADKMDYINLSSVPGGGFGNASILGGAWVYSWQPSSGGSGGGSISNAGGITTNISHEMLVGVTDGVMYSCDWRYLQSVKSTGTFDPTNTGTYTYAQKALSIPTYDTAQCLAELGTNIMVGGAYNAIYPWDRVSTGYSYPILISEYFIKKMATINTNTYIFAGRRGRIWITNGSQAQVYKKVPDHISGTIEPYYSWGGVAVDKQNIYFGVQATANDGTANSNYGALWALNVETDALRMLNEPSYATYAGLVTAIVIRQQDQATTPPAGYGLYFGWQDGSGNGGIDTYLSTPYTGGQSYIISDLIPVGTFLNPFSPSQVEWKTSVGLGNNGTNETISLHYRLNFSDAFTQIGTTTSSSGQLSDMYQVNFQKAQWVQLKVVLTSNATTPTYCRLKEIRIRDYTGPITSTLQTLQT